MNPSLPVLDHEELEAHLGAIDVVAALESSFAALREGLAVQPPQTLTLFPGDRGDFITYLGVLSQFDVFGAKLSPYIVTGAAPIISAWTMLMSMTSGRPLLLCDSGKLTTERTAAATALAVDKLARPDSAVLAVIGSGKAAQAHMRYVCKLRPWKEIRVFSPSLAGNATKQEAIRALPANLPVRFPASARECVAGADVVMLATSSGKPVMDVAHIGKPALITSISTNVARAHEIDPAALPGLDVYCDYKATTPASAGEMVLAAEAGLWSPDRVRGDLADLCTKDAVPLPAWEKSVFFRSIGLGIEDVAIAYALYRHINPINA